MLLKGGLVYEQGRLVPMDIEVTDGFVTGRGSSISSDADKVLDCHGLAVFPVFADVDGDPQVVLDREELSVAEWFEREEIPVKEISVSLTNEMILYFKEGKVNR